MNGTAIDEFDIRQWFKTCELEQANDTFKVVEGILEMRNEAKPQRRRRKDAGIPKTGPALPPADPEQPSLIDSLRAGSVEFSMTAPAADSVIETNPLAAADATPPERFVYPHRQPLPASDVIDDEGTPF